MNILQFTNSSFVLYQILPDHKKIDFLNRSFETEIDKLSQEIYQTHFGSVLSPVGETEIGIVSYFTDDGAKVNVFFHDDMMHINSDKLIPIKELIKTAFVDGNILILDKTFKKNAENRERFHMRYYRAYRRINYDDIPLPLSES